MKPLDVLRQAVTAYCRANTAAWEGLRRRLAVLDPWLAAGLAQLAAVVVLMGSGHPGAAWAVAAAAVWIPVLQQFLDH